VARRLSKQPYIDGVGGLLHRAQTDFAVEARLAGKPVLGLAVAALNDGVGLGLGSAIRGNGGMVSIALLIIDDEDERREDVSSIYVITREDTENLHDEIVQKLDSSFRTGQELIERINEVFHRLRLGPKALDQIASLTGNEHYFPQLVRHLRALNRSVMDWSGGKFVPREITSSGESRVTLKHPRYGPLRDFPAPAGFAQRRWSFHTKLMGANQRLYYDFEDLGAAASVVLIGYFGPHLGTVQYPT
jgi:hypothetical protein